MKKCILFCIATILTACANKHSYEPVRERVSLAGEWKTTLGTCNLPGTTDENRLGSGEHPKNVTHQLTRTHPFYGKVIYEKDIIIPDNWKGKRMVLFMERTKPSTLWVDGDSIGSLGHIYAPHTYLLPELAEGKHTIKIRIDNSEHSVPKEIQGSHAWTDGTQTNWNGILGDFHIEATPDTYIKDVQAYPSVKERKTAVILHINSSSKQKGTIKIESSSWNSAQTHTIPAIKEKVELNEGDNRIEMTLDMGEEMLTWSEFHPALYRLNASLSTKDGKDNQIIQFGMRDFATEGTQFTINGFKTFLRGKHDACVFPLTGYAPMDVESWRRIFRIAKYYGINYYRCHSYTPPKAAFEAADIEGIYFQAELPLWGTISARNPRLNNFLLNEANMTLDYLGNHPSFMMFGLGNELNGDVGIMRSWLEGFRKHDNRHLYSFGSNNFLGWQGPQEGEDYFTTCRVGWGEGYTSHVRSTFAFVDAEKGGILNNTRPNTRANYSGAIAKCPRPVIGHETGQFQIYPDYGEIEKYSGVLYPYNLEIFRERLKKNGLQDQAKNFHKASGRFAIQCYKADIEYALRTPGMGGFQMLDLQDFPGQGSALVGVLDAFMDSKGLVSADEFKGFCAPIVPLALMDSYCYSTTQKLCIDIAVSNYEEKEWTSPLQWSLAKKDSTGFCKQGEIEISVEQGAVAKVGEIKTSLAEIKEPTELRLTLSTGKYKNSYNLWVYPEKAPESEDGLHICKKLDHKAKKTLEQGGRVLLIPDHKDVEKQSIGGLFTPDYWNYAMFKSISENAGKEVSPGSLSLLMNEKHPLFRLFPTECHSNWQWWSIVRNARPLILDNTPHHYKPLIQVVDNVERNHKLGLLFEFSVLGGKVLVCMSNLDAIQDTPEGRQFRNAILAYMKSDHFSPQEEISPALLQNLFTTDVKEQGIKGVQNLSDYDVAPNKP